MLRNDYNTASDNIDDLSVDNKRMKSKIRELKADIIHDANLSYELDDKHVKIIKRLEDEIKELKHKLNESKCGGINND